LNEDGVGWALEIEKASRFGGPSDYAIPTANSQQWNSNG
jgi:hypothetical protein